MSAELTDEEMNTAHNATSVALSEYGWALNDPASKYHSMMLSIRDLNDKLADQLGLMKHGE